MFKMRYLWALICPLLAVASEFSSVDGEYFEVAYGTEIGGFDVGVGVIFSGSDLDDDEAMYFSLSKSFDL